MYKCSKLPSRPVPLESARATRRPTPEPQAPTTTPSPGSLDEGFARAPSVQRTGPIGVAARPRLAGLGPFSVDNPTELANRSIGARLVWKDHFGFVADDPRRPGPAELAGIQRGDEFLAINRVSLGREPARQRALASLRGDRAPWPW